jgi:class 3 adenylate cyclase
MGELPPDAAVANGKRRRRLRAVFAADVANFGNLVSASETKTLDALWNTRRIATEELTSTGGWLFGMPGDGLFALFESAVDAVRCALRTQSRLSALPSSMALTLRIGVHLGEVLFQDGLPFGETLVIAARLESLATPGGLLVSSTVKEAVEARISATFSDYSVRELKHIPRPIATFSVTAREDDLNATTVAVLRERPGPLGQMPPALAVSGATRLAELPKISPLAIPTEVSTSRSHPSTLDATDRVVPIAAACLAELTQALTTHVGPVARVLVKRHAATIVDLTALIAALGEEIPAERERREFIARAQQVVGRQPG